MASPFIKELEAARASQVGFVELEKGGPAGPVVAEIVSALARTDQQPWRFDFRTGALDTTEDWTIVKQETGHAIDASSGNLVMSTGATINTECVIRSKRRFTLPVRASVAFMLSQRVANQEFYIELANANGDVRASWKFDGTTNTAGKIEVTSGSIAANQTLNVAATTAATSSAAVVEIDLAMDECTFRTRPTDSNSAASDRGTRTSNLPHPDDELYLQIRAKNLGTAPTSTNFTIYYGFVQDVNELAVEVVGGRGVQGTGQAINFLGTLQATGNRIGATSAQAIWQDTNRTAQAIGATVTGTGRDLHGSAANAASSTASYFKEYRAVAISDVAGTLHLEVSHDNTTFRRIRSIATTQVGGTGLHVAELTEYKPVLRYARVVYVNGGTAQAHFTLAESYLSA